MLLLLHKVAGVRREKDQNQPHPIALRAFREEETYHLDDHAQHRPATKNRVK